MDERDIEVSEANVAMEAVRAVSKIRGQIAEAGTDECEACGAIIPEERRKAAPWATRCLCCQELAERSFRV